MWKQWQVKEFYGVYALESVVYSHNLYKCTWTPQVGELLHVHLSHKENNENDLKEVAIAMWNNYLSAAFPVPPPLVWSAVIRYMYTNQN